MVYARVSKTRGCNDLESSSLSSGTMVSKSKQYEMDLVFPKLMLVDKSADMVFQRNCRDAERLLNSAGFINLVRITADRGVEAIEDVNLRAKYALALDIQWGVVRFGENGWARPIVETIEE